MGYFMTLAGVVLAVVAFIYTVNFIDDGKRLVKILPIL
jgi:hypothetical protein